jgi:hypothetical protein
MACLLTGSLAYSGDINPGYISEDAQWYMHLNVDAANNTALTQNYSAEIEKAVLSVSEFKDLDLKPNEDIDGVTIYGNYAQQKSILIIEGKFDEFLIKDFIESKVDEENLNGLRLYKHKNLVGVIYNFNTIVVANNTAHLESGIKVLSGESTSLSPDSNLINPGSIAHGSLSGLDQIQKEVKKYGKTVLLKAPIEQFDFSVSEVNNGLAGKVTFNADAKTSENIYNVLNGIKSYLELNFTGDTQLLDILSYIQLSKDDSSASIATDLPTDVLIGLIEKYSPKIAEEAAKIKK